MQEKDKCERVLIDGSRLMIESMARAGADAFIGYPITPANLLYAYGSQRMSIMLPAPDEITTLQWMSGLSITGKIPVTATSYPGLALMIESVNMAYMMELPMVIVLVQRLGPATGTATCGAQGDLLALKGMMSGGHPLPVLATSNFEDCWKLSEKAVHIAAKLRTPVVLLTSKEEVMTQKSFDLNLLDNIKQTQLKYFDKDSNYKTYDAEGLVPEFLPVNQNVHQVRFNASTHDQYGILQHSSEDALNNTRRLEKKINEYLDEYTYYDYDQQDGAKNIVVSYGISSAAAIDAVSDLRKQGIKTSLLIPKTLIPVTNVYKKIINKYKKTVIAEENINNQFGQLLFGVERPENIRFVEGLGKMITPEEIIKEVKK